MNLISKFLVVFFGISLSPIALAGGNEKAQHLGKNRLEALASSKSTSIKASGFGTRPRSDLILD